MESEKLAGELAGRPTEEASDCFAEVLREVRNIVPDDQQRLVLDLEEAAAARDFDRAGACFVLAVALALRPQEAA